MTQSFEDLGPNSGLVEEMYRQYLENPQSVAESWRDFFEDYQPRWSQPNGNSGTAATAAAPTAPAPAPSSVGIRTEPSEPQPSSTAPLLDGEQPVPLRGAAARIVENMEASLKVPTATSLRVVPAKLLEVNRQILNNHLRRTGGGGKVSFTHLIAYAVVRALAKVPNMNSGYGLVDGKPVVVRHEHVNLGLAVDVHKSDGTRSLLVPNIKAADTLDFARFFAAYEELIRKVRTGKLDPADFAGTTASITNPGTIGTVSSVPRLMPGQGFIVGVGAIGYPAEYEGTDPATLARIAVGRIVTLTSTYDHRVIQGAESGEFLGSVHRLVLGEDQFYDDVFRSFGVPYEPARWSADVSIDDAISADEKVVSVQQLINMYRVRGHLIAHLDPLGRTEVHTHPELDINQHGLTIWDLEREFPTDGLAGTRSMKLHDILGVLRDAYSRTVGVEYMHIQEPDQKAWIQEQVEGVDNTVTPEEQRRILERLNAAEAFERFLHTKYLGHKRFSLEGAETLIPMLDALLNEAADAGITEAVLGMAHRGRLNVLANVIGKSYGQIFREFEGELDPMSSQGSGDVKYHLGARGTHTTPAGEKVALTLASNPSHLEAVDPVVEGMARAKEDASDDERHGTVLPVLVHGDAAFAGQGVVAETFNLSAVPGYEVGGTVHLVVNNQLGFTTGPEAGRSSVYATDVAKMVQAPIFHVNGDDPEAAVRVVRLAFAFRQAFSKDVVVDLVCYRRYGHNEADEPAFTQPAMYALIDQHRSVRKLYTEQLINRGDLTLEEAEAAFADFRGRLDAAFEETHQSGPPTGEVRAIPQQQREPVATAVGRDVLARVVDGLTNRPEGFTVNRKLERILQAHRVAFERDEVDWTLAEAAAFGSMVLEGTPVRVAGQDTRRGTFSQRHGVLIDANTEREYFPLANLSPDQAPFMLYDSVLSEYAALGFEYGYSVSAPGSFVGWEAQFGDFINGAQIVVDQFIVAAEDKWGQRSALTLLLPHAYEGQGPEHSSARMERFLALCAEDNMRVVYPSNAAQYFHVLRRQVKDPLRRPLIVFTPKRYLRMPHTRSSVAALTDDRFHEVLDDRAADAADRDAVRRVLLCTGKIAHELMDRRDERGAPVAVVRIEQLYPFPDDEINGVLARYPNATQVWWVQEEPDNMGAWNFVHRRLHRVLRDRDLRHIAREASASPASGSQTVHDREQNELFDAALADL
jgi:2-oxoglutarate dehydrogenase E1 component